MGDPTVKHIRILFVEDVEDHVLLIVRELQKGGLEIEFQRVETLQELEAALEAGWDAIISDFNLPGFDGIDVLKMVQQKRLDLPFLLVSGAIGEEKAAEVMKAGAHDYIRKGNYARLVPSLERELRDAKLRHERRQTAEELSRYREQLEELVQERTAELVRVNQALQDEKQEREQVLLQLEAVLEGVEEGVVISDLQGNVLLMNREALALLHEYRKPDHHQVPQFREIFELRDPEGRSVPFEEWPLVRAMRGERFSDCEVEIIRKDGAARPWIASVSGGPVLGKGGEAILAVVTFRDIKDRKRSQEALRKSEHKFSKIFGAAPALIGILSLEDGRIIDVNENALATLGYQREEVIGRTVVELEICEEPADCAGILLALGQEGAVRNLEVRFKGKNAQNFTGMLSAEIIVLDHARYMLCLVGDITERKRAEEEIVRLNAALAARIAQLEETNQDLEAFNRIVSHDLRQPLNTVALACQELELLYGDKLGPDEIRSVKVALAGVQRMNGLIESLLRFARSSHGVVNCEQVDLSSLGEGVIEQLKLGEPERRVSFRLQQGITIVGDPVLLRSVMDNLLGNAWKYTGMRQEAVIEFGATQIDGREAYFVRDNGVGFEMADAAKLFNPFERLDGGRQFEGFGIGLATVQRIILRHGGQIWAEGEPGRGATFYFTVNTTKGICGQ